MKIIRYSQMAWIRARSAEGPSWAVIASRVDSSSAAGVPSALLAFSLQEPFDAGCRPVSQVALQDRPGGGKPRAAVQVSHALRRSHGRAAVGSKGFQAQAGSSSGCFDATLSSFRLPFGSPGELELQLNPGRARVIANDEPAVAEVAQERQT